MSITTTTTLLSIMGAFLLLCALILILAGLEIITIKQWIEITPGTRTLLAGLFFALLGGALLTPDVRTMFVNIASNESQTTTIASSETTHATTIPSTTEFPAPTPTDGTTKDQVTVTASLVVPTAMSTDTPVPQTNSSAPTSTQTLLTPTPNRLAGLMLYDSILGKPPTDLCPLWHRLIQDQIVGGECPREVTSWIAWPEMKITSGAQLIIQSDVTINEPACAMFSNDLANYTLNTGGIVVPDWHEYGNNVGTNINIQNTSQFTLYWRCDDIIPEMKNTK